MVAAASHPAVRTYNSVPEVFQPAETIVRPQRRSAKLRQRNRMLAAMLAIVAVAALVVVLTLVMAIHNAETGHALAIF